MMDFIDGITTLLETWKKKITFYLIINLLLFMLYVSQLDSNLSNPYTRALSPP